MTRCENEVFSRLEAAITAEYPDANVSSIYVHSPASFPHVSIEMTDSQIMRLAMTNGDSDRIDVVVFTINIYSNDKVNKRSICRNILEVIDDEMYGMNFTRLSANPVPNMADATIYRITARYRAATDGKYFYRR